MTPEDKKEIEDLIEKHNWSGWILFFFLLFLSGCFKGCGY